MKHLKNNRGGGPVFEWYHIPWILFVYYWYVSIPIGILLGVLWVWAKRKLMRRKK